MSDPRPKRQAYPSDLSDDQWEVLEPLIPPAKPGGRPRKRDPREIMNALFYVARSGCAWRMLPHDFPPWQTVYDYRTKWKEAGVWEHVHDCLCRFVRLEEGREAAPSVAYIDTQSVKAGKRGAEPVTIRPRKRTDAKGTSLSIRSD
jgi:putative transposase